MTDAYDYDLIVLGGGMAGLPVAMKCAYSGMDTALIEKDLLGGTCLNRGCIPAKTMLRSAEIVNLARRSDEFGIDTDGEITADTDAIVRARTMSLKTSARGRTTTSKATATSRSSKNTASSSQPTRCESVTEPSQPRVSSSTPGRDRRDHRSTVSTRSTC